MIKIRIRVIVGIMIFLGYFLIYVSRYNISVHIIDMARLYGKENYSEQLSIITRNRNKKIVHKIKTTLKLTSGYSSDLIAWNDRKMAKLFAAYYIGYCVCFPIFHNVGDKIGPVWVVGIAGMLSGVVGCLTPAAAFYDFWSLFVVRIINGFCAGAMQPSMVQVLRNWVPPIERNHFMWAYCGITAGTFSTFLICAAVQYHSRWPVGFYITGTTHIVWSLVWVSIVSDHPRKNACISDEEMEYLSATIGTIFTIQVTNAQAPWRSIIKSVPFWALVILNFGYAWMIISICIHAPLYYSMVIGYTISQAAALTALPFFLRLVLGTIIIHTFHWYKLNRSKHKVTLVRQCFIVVTHVVPGLLVASTWMFPIFPGPVFLTIAVALTAAGMDLTFDLCSEMTPTFVNSVHTVIKIIGNVPGIIVAFSVGEVVSKFKNSPNIWKHIWCFHAMVLCISGVVFLIWGEMEVQPWNAERRRLQRKSRPIKIRQSVMSNIPELDENESIHRLSGGGSGRKKLPFMPSTVQHSSQKV